MNNKEGDGPLRSRHYQVKAENLLSGLTGLWRNECLFDIKLIAEGKEFLAHKVILAASSPYFEAMFTHGFKEKECVKSTGGIPSIVLHNISSKALEVIIKTIYTGELEIHNYNFKEIVELASYLQYEQILYYCEAFMEDSIYAYNCFDYLEIAHKYNLNYAFKVVIQNVMDNFDIVFDAVCNALNDFKIEGWQINKFLELPKEVLVQILSSDTLVIGEEFCEENEKELSFYKLACQWLDHNPERAAFAAEVLHNIRFALMTVEQLKDVSMTVHVMQNDSCLKRIMEAEEYHQNVVARPLCDESLHTPRGDLEFIFLELNMQDDYLTFTSYDNRNLQNYRVLVPFLERIMPLSVKCIHIGHYVYFHGVTSGTGHYNNVLFRCMGDWTDEECMQMTPLDGSGRFWCVTTYCDGHIFVLGGILMQDWMHSQEQNFHKHVTNTCYRYSVRFNSWEEISSLPQRCLHGEGAAWNDTVYYAGPAMFGNGERADELLSDSFDCLLAYNVFGNTWKEKAPMLHRREKFSLNAVNGKLFALGGLQRYPNREVAHLPSEVYDIECDQWTHLDTSDEHHDLWISTLSCVHKTDIYLLGEGLSWSADGYPERLEHYKDIHVYHTKTNTWSVLNYERELKISEMPHLMCYRIPPGTGKGVTSYPLPRVKNS